MLPLFAIARRRPALEFYISVGGGQAIGWTDNLDYAWCIEKLDDAEKVLAVVQAEGHFDAFIYVFRGELER